VVRKKYVDLGKKYDESISAAHEHGTEELPMHVGGADAEGILQPNCLDLERPDPAPWPFTVLYVGVDSGGKGDPDLNLNAEFQKIEQALKECLKGSSNHVRIKLKQTFYSDSSDLMIQIRTEMPTVVQIGSHATEKGGVELFRQTIFKELVLMITTWNEMARSKTPPRPHVRLVAFNSCESDALAKMLAEAGVEFVIGHKGPVEDHAAIKFSYLLYHCLFDRESLRASFTQARSASKNYILFPQKDPSQFWLVPAQIDSPVDI
jgi:hypothetical protein